MSNMFCEFFTCCPVICQKNVIPKQKPCPFAHPADHVADIADATQEIAAGCGERIRLLPGRHIFLADNGAACE